MRRTATTTPASMRARRRLSKRRYGSTMCAPPIRTATAAPPISCPPLSWSWTATTTTRTTRTIGSHPRSSATNSPMCPSPSPRAGTTTCPRKEGAHGLASMRTSRFVRSPMPMPTPASSAPYTPITHSSMRTHWTRRASSSARAKAAFSGMRDGWISTRRSGSTRGRRRIRTAR